MFFLFGFFFFSLFHCNNKSGRTIWIFLKFEWRQYFLLEWDRYSIQILLTKSKIAPFARVRKPLITNLYRTVIKWQVIINKDLRVRTSYTVISGFMLYGRGFLANTIFCFLQSIEKGYNLLSRLALHFHLTMKFRGSKIHKLNTSWIYRIYVNSMYLSVIYVHPRHVYKVCFVSVYQNAYLRLNCTISRW